MNRYARDLSGGKLLGVGAANLLHIDDAYGRLQSFRDEAKCAHEQLIRMTTPNLSRSQAKCIHVNHRVGRSDLLLGQVLDVETRTDLKLLLVGESNENVSMFAGLSLHGFVQRGEKGRTAPVIDYAISFGHAIKVGTNDDHLV